VRSLFGIEISAAVQYLIAFIIIFVLLALFAVILRRVTAPRGSTANQAGSRSRQPRLGVIDSFDIDSRRQLVLVRRDNVEHLIMIGGPNDVVIESSIVRNAQRSASPPSPPVSVGDALAQISASPALAVADPVPPLRPSAVEAQQDPRPEARLEIRPEVRPEAKQGGRAPEGRMPERVVTAPSPAAADRPSAPTETAPLGRDTARLSARDLGRERPSTTNGIQPPARPRPPLPSAARAAEQPGEAKPTAAPPADANAPEDELAAMTRHLGEVLQRPFASARPAESAPATTAERPAPPAIPLATARPRQSAPFPLQERASAPEKPAISAQESPVVAVDPPRPPAGQRLQNDEKAQEPSSAPASEPPTKAAVDPFSVDDIEAEFARLLGRIPPR
jgi:hypothetical protein